MSEGKLFVIGLGPGPACWLSPEASDALARLTDLVGYAAYVERAAPPAGVNVHASDNRVELDRARHALGLAADGDCRGHGIGRRDHRHVVREEVSDIGVLRERSGAGEPAAHEGSDRQQPADAKLHGGPPDGGSGPAAIRAVLIDLDRHSPDSGLLWARIARSNVLGNSRSRLACAASGRTS